MHFTDPILLRHFTPTPLVAALYSDPILVAKDFINEFCTFVSGINCQCPGHKVLSYGSYGMVCSERKHYNYDR